MYPKMYLYMPINMLEKITTAWYICINNTFFTYINASAVLLVNYFSFNQFVPVSDTYCKKRMKEQKKSSLSSFNFYKLKYLYWSPFSRLTMTIFFLIRDWRWKNNKLANNKQCFSLLVKKMEKESGTFFSFPLSLALKTCKTSL